MLMFALMKEKSVSFVTFVGVSFRGAHAPLFLGGAYLTVLLLFYDSLIVAGVAR